MGIRSALLRKWGRTVFSIEAMPITEQILTNEELRAGLVQRLGPNFSIDEAQM